MKEQDFELTFKYVLFQAPSCNSCVPPKSQDNDPSNTAVKVVKKNLTAVYAGFCQYDHRCFHKQAINWVKSD